MDLQEVNRLLEGWAAWVLRRLDDDLGFSRETTLGRIKRLGLVGAAICSGYDGPRTVPGNSTAEKVDKAIIRLSPCLRDAVKLHYLEGCWTDSRKAKTLGVSYGGIESASQSREAHHEKLYPHLPANKAP